MSVKMVSRRGKKSKIRSSKKAELELNLPTEKSIPSSTLQDYSILIFGLKKIGKTTLMAQFPNTLFLMTEPGGRALSIRQVQVRNWVEFKGYVALAIKDDMTKTIVVDTADFCYEYCFQYVCEQMAVEHPSDESFGKGWASIRKEFTSVVSELLHSDKGVIFISHSKETEFKTRHSETFNKVVSSMPGQAKDVLESLIDIWGHYTYDGKRRILIIGGSDEVDAGHRIEGRFKYPSGEPMETIEMGRSPKEGYRNFVNAFNNCIEIKLKNQNKQKKGKKLVLR